MAVRTSSPWWVSAILTLGLLSLFAGQRVLAHLDSTSTVLTIFGLILVAGSTAIRFWSFRREKGARRSVELLFLACHGGVILSLLIYLLLGTEWGQHRFGIEDSSDAAAKATTIATVGWVLVMGLSLLPLLMVELSLGVTGRDWFPKAGDKVADDAAVELFRVRDMATSGLTIALAAGFLLVTCNVAKERDVRKDVSYFKTSSPGSGTVNMVSSLSQPIRVLLFFPQVNQVADEVEAYFKQLDDATGKVSIERHDRLVSPGLAKDYQVQVDGTVVLVQGETPEEKEKREKTDRKPGSKEDEGKTPAEKAATKTVPPNQKLNLTTDFQRARRDKLREFDGDVQKALMKIIRARRVAYFSVGHGELNDPKSAGPQELVDPKARTAAFKQILTILNYEIKEWDGFGKPVPDDATLLVVLGPRQPLLEEDLKAIDEYLDQGGALFIALDPKSEATLGLLEGRLGVKFDRTPIADDKEFYPLRRNASDHRVILTNQFSSHASVTTMSRAGVRAGIPILESGNLVDTEFMVEKGQDTPKRTYVIRSLMSSFLDKPSADAPQGNNVFDEKTEKKTRYNVAAAVEDPSRTKDKDKTEDAGKEKKSSRGMRAMVFADVDMFEDRPLTSVGGLQLVVRDAALWLGGEEDLAGETIEEKDTVIEHTQSEDVVWFYLSLVGAPVVILGAGLGGVLWRRRRAQRRRS